jgi:hypothetical protein
MRWPLQAVGTGGIHQDGHPFRPEFPTFGVSATRPYAAEMRDLRFVTSSVPGHRAHFVPRACSGTVCAVTRLRWIVPVVLAVVLVAAAAPHLRDYGATWDEALGDLFFGQRYAAFFTSFDAKYLDFARGPAMQPDFSMSPFRILPEQYYPLANMLAYGTSRVLARWLDPVDGFHAFNVLLAAAFVIVFFDWIRRRFSMVVAVTTIALLFTTPRIWYDLMVNVKDFPEMVFFTLAAIAFYEALRRNTTGWFVLAGVLLGCALAAKPNALFLPFVPFAYLLATRRRERATWLRFVAAGLLGVAVMIALWPWLWSDPIGRLHENLRYLTIRANDTAPAQRTSPLTMVLLTTQPLLLMLVPFGLVAAVRRKQWFLLCWLTVIALRLALPGSINFDGVRHFLELFRPLALAAAFALERLRPRVALAIALIAVVPGIAGIVQMHPFEDAYWNVFAGGLRGAASRQIPQWGEYWGTSYRQGIDWLNHYAPPNSAIAVPIAEQTVALVAPFRLRPDLELVRYKPALPPYDRDRLPHLVARSKRQPVFIMFITREEAANELTRIAERQLQPVAEWSRDGIALMRIYDARKTKKPPVSRRPADQ